MDRMELSESGLVIKQIKIIANYDKYNPARGSFIDLPKWVNDKKAFYQHTQQQRKDVFQVRCSMWSLQGL